MRKFLLIMPMVILLAAGCTSKSGTLPLESEVVIVGTFNEYTSEQGLQDGPTYAVIKSDGYGTVRVQMGGFSSECAGYISPDIKPGEKVEAYGRTYGTDTMTVCSFDKYYLKKSAYAGFARVENGTVTDEPGGKSNRSIPC